MRTLMLLTLFSTIILCAYMDGQIHVNAKRADALIQSRQQYAALVSSVDYVTYLDGVKRYQDGE